jgi:hypothetical protein
MPAIAPQTHLENGLIDGYESELGAPHSEATRSEIRSRIQFANRQRIDAGRAFFPGTVKNSADGVAPPFRF